MGAEAENTEPLPTALGEEGAERRITFILRLTVDERGQPRRTEIEHAQSGKKESSPGLDVRRLTAFMEACTGHPVLAEPAIPLLAPPVKAEAPAPEPPVPTFGLVVSDVQVFRTGVAGLADLVLNPDEAFIVQARFRLHGREAPSLAARRSAYELKVYAREVTSGTCTLLTTYRASLAENVSEYTAQMHVPGLSPGFYRLITLVTLPAPINMGSQYEGPIVDVSGV
jgi:hypothetical protein